MVNLLKSDRHSMAMSARAKLGEARCDSIWQSILNNEVDCLPDTRGSRPCDNGSTCCKCREEHYGELYVDRLLLAAKDK